MAMGAWPEKEIAVFAKDHVLTMNQRRMNVSKIKSFRSHKVLKPDLKTGLKTPHSTGEKASWQVNPL
jgi:hypothetical protein